jgi:hypothetical protein
VGLAAWIGLGGAASCSSDDQVPGGRRVEHPIEPGPKVEPGPTRASPPPTSLAPPPASAAETSASSEDRRPSRSDLYEQNTGIKLSPRDKAILDDCPNRAWSKNVPERRCATDDECGDGFCDRDRCAPFWTCSAWYGVRCEKNRQCGSYPCIDGRCRSCVSDTECEWARHIQDPKCTPEPWVPGSRMCNGVVPSIIGDVAPGLPPPRPKQ